MKSKAKVRIRQPRIKRGQIVFISIVRDPHIADQIRLFGREIDAIQHTANAVRELKADRYDMTYGDQYSPTVEFSTTKGEDGPHGWVEQREVDR